MVINARSLVKSDAAAALYTELHTNKIDFCFVSETGLNSRVVSSLLYSDGCLIVWKDRCDLRTGGELFAETTRRSNARISKMPSWNVYDVKLLLLISKSCSRCLPPPKSSKR